MILGICYFLILIVKKWYLIGFFLGIFFLFQLPVLKETLTPFNLGLHYKEQAVKRIAEIDQKFNVSYAVPIGYDTGYRYLLDYYQVKQTGDFNDSLIQVVIPPKNTEEIYGGIGLQIPDQLIKKLK